MKVLRRIRKPQESSRGENQREQNDRERNNEDDRLAVLPRFDRVIREFQLGNGHNNGLIFYVRKADRAYINRQGEMLGRLISLRDDHVNEVMMATDSARLIEEECSTLDLTDVLIMHVECMKALLARDIQTAFKRQIACTVFLTNLLESPSHLNEDWTLHLLYSVALDTRIVTGRAAASGCAALDITNLDMAADALLSCFRLCSRPGSHKRAGILDISNQLIAVFFGMKQLGLHRPLLNDLEINPINQYLPFAPQRGTFQNFAHAHDFYDFAFEHCPPEYDRYKRLILIRLVPLKMAKGVMPNQALMQANNLNMLYDLGVAMETGNLSLFDRIVFHCTQFFVTHGLYNFITQHLRYDTQQNAQEINYCLGQENSNFLEVAVYQHALEVNATREADREAFPWYLSSCCSNDTFKECMHMFTNQVFFPQDEVLPNLN
ncbi:PCI domain-containing protein 2 homolog [Epargyreus clarus]|uniref:PCI domain-containing protein 2 homolog n=1 Tax=Epargyreus clarus TaxID=520877 RepID=UPI003C2CB5E6